MAFCGVSLGVGRQRFFRVGHCLFFLLCAVVSDFGAPVSADKSCKKPLSSLKYLLFDGHAGPLSSSFSFLVTQLGVPSENIDVACNPFGCNRLHLNIPLPINRLESMERWFPINFDFMNMEPIYDDGWREMFRQKFQRTFDKYDVIFCSQPMKLCSLLRMFKKLVVLRADKRFDHRVGMSDDLVKSDQTSRFGSNNNNELISIARRDAWARELAEWARSEEEPLVLLHANPYDEKYMQYYLGVGSTLLEAYPVWPRWKASWAPQLDELIVLPDQEALLGQRARWEEAIVFPLREKGVQVRFMRDVYPVYTYKQLAAHKSMLYLPYDANTWTQREMYSIGIPMFAPSETFLARLHCTRGVIGHRCANNTGNAPPSLDDNVAAFLKRSNGGHNFSTPTLDPNSGECNAVMQWARYMDTTTQGHLLLFDSVDHLAELIREVSLDNERLQGVHEKMIKHQDKTAAEQAQAVKSKIKEKLYGNAEPDVCLGGWGGSATVRTKEDILGSELALFAQKNREGLPDIDEESCVSAQCWLNVLQALVADIKHHHKFLPRAAGVGIHEKVGVLRNLVSLANAAYCLDCSNSEVALGPAVLQSFQAVQNALKKVDKHVANPKLFKLMKKTRALISTLGRRISEGTKTKAALLVDSIHKVGGNWKDLSNLGALILNAAQEAGLHSWKPAKARSAMLLSLRISELSLELSPANVITMSNIKAASSTLRQHYKMSDEEIQRQEDASKKVPRRKLTWWSMFVDVEEAALNFPGRIQDFAKMAPFVQMFSSVYETDARCTTILNDEKLELKGTVDISRSGNTVSLPWCRFLRFLRSCKTKGKGDGGDMVKACVLIDSAAVLRKEDFKTIDASLASFKPGILFVSFGPTPGAVNAIAPAMVTGILKVIRDKRIQSLLDLLLALGDKVWRLKEKPL